MLHVLQEKGYEQGTFLCTNPNFKSKIMLRYCDISFGVVISRKCESAMATSHYFALSCTLQTLLKLVIYTLMSYFSTSIDILYAFTSLNLLLLHGVAYCVRLDM